MSDKYHKTCKEKMSSRTWTATLSPTLFNIFLSDLQDITEKTECEPVRIKGDIAAGCLIWADDLVLLSRSQRLA